MPFSFWPYLAHFLGVSCTLTIMQVCFQISIVYPPRALSASVCVVALAGAGLSLQIQFSLKIRATLSSSSPGIFIASFCLASLPFYHPSCTHLTRKRSARDRVLSWFGDPKHFNELLYIVTRSLKVVIFNRLGSTDFFGGVGRLGFDNNLMTIKWPQK